MKIKLNHKLRQCMFLSRSAAQVLLAQAIVGTLILTAWTGLLLAQGVSGSSHHPSYDPKKPLPLPLPEAYVLAVNRMGVATNRFHCVRATCVDMDNQWSTGWRFGFSDTNGEGVSVKVFFNKDVWLDPQSAALIR
jgi:hypothetical protein